MSDLKTNIEQHLQRFQTLELRPAALALLDSLGYASDKTMELDGSPAAFLEQFNQNPEATRFNEEKALSNDWKEIQLLFQLTDQELASQVDLFEDNAVKQSLMTSYLFFAVKLSGEGYARGKLAQIARQINRLFPMPVMVLFEYGGKLSIAVINRRRNKRDTDKDVLGKVTLIQDICLETPHRGHLDILESFAVSELRKTHTVSSFDTLHAAWEEVFNVELLNEKFYRKIQEWFFWAVDEVRFPHGGIDDDDQRNRIAMIRMLTRVIFCWFAKEKELLSPQLFDRKTAEDLLVDFKPNSSKEGGYYQAFLQNLFFAVLSIPLEDRKLRDRRSYQGRNNHYMNHAKLRFRDLFSDSKAPDELFSNIPFLNGGLFECLDYRTKVNEKNVETRVDGFSDNPKKQALVPNVLFFGKNQTADLHEALNDDHKSEVQVDGLFTILDRFKFTVTENTPVEQEIALDPELLGKVFENLLAEYNPETEKSARNDTGSFYTPRSIVDYMVDESLKASLLKALIVSQASSLPDSSPKQGRQDACGTKNPLMSEEDAKTGLDILFSYTEQDHAFNDAEKHVLLDAIYELTILDPACGSGAFPMGMLQKLVYVLEKLDTGHEHWKQRIIDDTPATNKADTRKLLDGSSADFKWKLGLIQRCIYGIDIQPIAVQIAKLRCFVSLLVDFDVDPKKKNFGVPSLPNLDFKFVAANSLINPPSGIERDGELGFTDPFFDQFAALAEDYFFVRVPSEKKTLRKKIEKLIEGKIQERESSVKEKLKALRLDKSTTKQIGLYEREKKRFVAGQKKVEAAIEAAEREANLWESYRNLFAFRNDHVGFFDPRYFFPEIGNGFDIVIGNPPYVQIQNFSGQACQKQWQEQDFKTFAKTGDIYCLFYERSYELLRSGGVLSFITSNKWMRAGYGKAMRKYLLKNGQMNQLIDFGDSPVFKAATTYTNILLWSKNEGLKKPPVVYDLNAVYAENATLNNMLLSAGADEPIFSEHSFVIAGKDQARIKKRIEQVGTPLKEWDVSINYGIKTGCNEAFIISGEKKDELITQDPKSVEIIKPILRGRDIKRYQENFADLWIVSTFPALHIDIDDYPAVRDYLKTFGKRLEQTGLSGCRKKTNNKWFEVQDSISYFEEFGKEKVLYAEIVYDSAFFYDTRDFYPEATTFMMTGENLKYLTALLNSKLLTYAFKTFYAGGDLRGNTFRYKKVFLNQLPIPRIGKAEQTPFEVLVDKIQAQKKENPEADVTELEGEIDQLVHKLYDLTEEEIAIVEGK